MKTNLIRVPIKCATKLLLAALTILSLQFTASAQGTAFTYQGRLNDGANPANGTYNFRFALFDALTVGNQVGSPLTNSPVTVSNGLFTVALDFGNQFPGADRWLEIAVRTNGGGVFFTLIPRQPLTPAPYAITAGSVVSGGITGTYGNAVTFNNANNNFSGAFTGNGANLANVNAATLGGLSSSGFWKTTGNAGTAGANFIGTSDNQPLEFKVNGARGLRIEPGNPTNGAPNIIGGSENNVVDTGVVGAFIGGGGTTNYFGSAFKNRVSTDFGTIAGGYFNTIQSNAYQSSIVGGYANTVQTGAQSSTIGGGQLNTIGANAYQSTISGGNVNTIQSPRSFIGGGIINTIQSGDLSAIGGGAYNTIQTNAAYAVIGGGYYNVIQTLAYQSSIVGGESNTIAVNSHYAMIGGGYGNTASGPGAFVGGGFDNSANGVGATVPGGVGNIAAGNRSFAAGSSARANHDGSFVWADIQPLSSGFDSTASNQFLIRASGGVGIGLNNPTSPLHVASAGNTPQVQITQNTAGNFTRLRMNVFGSPSWEMDVGGGATPGISWWTGSLKMNLDYNGNLTTAGTVNGSSDRNVKEHFVPVSSREVLEKVSSLPITEWNYITDGETLRHIGPMAQDFYAAFNVGTDDKHISMVDADGVALAAIQGLNRKVEDSGQESEVRIQKLEAENAELKQRLEALEKIVCKQKSN